MSARTEYQPNSSTCSRGSGRGGQRRAGHASRNKKGSDTLAAAGGAGSPRPRSRPFSAVVASRQAARGSPSPRSRDRDRDRDSGGPPLASTMSASPHRMASHYKQQPAAAGSSAQQGSAVGSSRPKSATAALASRSVDEGLDSGGEGQEEFQHLSDAPSASSVEQVTAHI